MPRHTDKGQAQSAVLRAFVLKEWEVDADPAPLLEQINSLPGVQRAEFNPKAKRLILLGSLDVNELQATLEKLGLELVEEDQERQERSGLKLPTSPLERLGRRFAGAAEWVRTLLWLVPASFFVGVLLSLIAAAPAPSKWLLVGVGVLLLGTGLFVGGIRLFKRLPRLSDTGRTDTILLVAILVMAQALRGAWLEAALVLLLYTAVYWLPLFARQRLEMLWRRPIQLLPASVRLAGEHKSGEGEAADGESMVPVEEVLPGTRFLVRAGEVVGLDGRVAEESEAVISTLHVTGESLPFIPAPQSFVPAGSKVESGELVLICERPFQKSLLFALRPEELLARSEAVLLQSPLARSLEALPQILIYVATAVMLLPPLFFGEAIQPWMNRGLALLLLAPINTLLFGLLGPALALRVRLAELGVEQAEWNRLRTLERVTRLVLMSSFIVDPRQTLTAIEPCSAVTEGDALRLAASLMSGVNDPIGEAFVEAAAGEDLEALTPLRLGRFDGNGIEGTVRYGGESWQLAVGTTSWMQRRGVVLPEDFEPSTAGGSGQGVTVLWLAYEQQALAAFLLQSRLRDGSRRFLQKLRKTGVKRIDLLTSREKSVTGGFVREVGLDEVHAELTPEEMEELVAAWQDAGEVCVVAGQPLDGTLPAGEHVNLAFGSDDVPSGTGGTIAVVARDPAQLYPILLVARRAKRARSCALLVAFAAKAVLLLIALSAAPSLWRMAAVEAFSSLLVGLSTLSLWRRL